MWCGLEPYFIDIRRDDWCMDESILTETLDRLGNQAACVVTYATFGTCLNLSRYEALHRSGMPVIIDAASSFGASSDGDYFGRGFSGPVVYSFHATKTFGIGEGGLVTAQITISSGDFVRRAISVSLRTGCRSFRALTVNCRNMQRLSHLRHSMCFQEKRAKRKRIHDGIWTGSKPPACFRGAGNRRIRRRDPPANRFFSMP